MWRGRHCDMMASLQNLLSYENSHSGVDFEWYSQHLLLEMRVTEYKNMVVDLGNKFCSLNCLPLRYQNVIFSYKYHFILKLIVFPVLTYILLHKKVINFHIWTFWIEYTEKPQEWIITEWHILLPIILKSCLTSPPKIYFKQSVRLHSTNFLYISQRNIEMSSDMVLEYSDVSLGLNTTSSFPSAYTLQSVEVGEHGRLPGRLTESRQDLSRCGWN